MKEGGKTPFPSLSIKSLGYGKLHRMFFYIIITALKNSDCFNETECFNLIKKGTFSQQGAGQATAVMQSCSRPAGRVYVSGSDATLPVACPTCGGI